MLREAANPLVINAHRREVPVVDEAKRLERLRRDLHPVKFSHAPSLALHPIRAHHQVQQQFSAEAVAGHGKGQTDPPR